MKVAYLLGSLSRGGTETLVLDVFKNSDKASYDFVGVHRKDGPLKDEFYATKPDFIKCGPKGFHFISYLYRLRELLKSNHVDIAHAQQFLDAIYAKLACMGTGIKVVETFHGYDFGTGWLNRLMIKLSMMFSDAICFVSEEEKRYYLEKYGQRFSSKSYVVYNGVNFDKIIKVKDTSTTSNDDLKPLQMGAVGNFVIGRDQFTLCKFLHLLDMEGVEFKFYFVGRRNDKEPWRFDDCVKFCQENGLSDKVEFLGARSDVPELLASWDAFLYSTDHDTFGIAVVEAIAAGVPTFVNDWSVMNEITDNGKLAHLYKTKNPEDLLRVFNDFLQNRAAYEQEAQENAIIIRQKFSIQQHLETLSGVYGVIVG
ncbi:MAG: glycosyltransferase family 4 protein [Bacteroidales bacterium]|nr:glycosyltransferase family 4 protein [Bacteroidales bacterium]